MSEPFRLTRIPSLKTVQRLSVIIVLTAVFIGCVSKAAPSRSTQQSEAELEKKLDELAAQIPFIMPDSVAYQRVPHEAREDLGLMEVQERVAFDSFMALAKSADESAAWKLTTHGNPRVRTLAIICVYWHGNPQRLPGLNELCEDSAKTFPKLGGWGSGGPPFANSVEERRRKVGIIEQTVGDIAKQIVGAYFDASRAWTTSFDAYWEKRKDRDACLGWYEVSVKRAMRGTMTFRSECAPAVLKLREDVAKLDQPYRAWITLALRESSSWDDENVGADLFANGTEIAVAAREIGAPTLMRLFKGRLESDDPDFSLRSQGTFQYANVCRLVLSHAAEVFSPEESNAILALEDFHRTWGNRELAFVHPCWAIAASDLAPARAREILLAAFERFNGRTEQESRREIAQAFWKHTQMDGVDVVKNWFYSEVPDKRSYGTARHGFAQWLADPTHKRLLQAIILDPRLEELDSFTILYLLSSTNKSLGRAVVSNEEVHEFNSYASNLIDEDGLAEAQRLAPDPVKRHLANRPKVLEKLRAVFKE
ncbi:MAG: hypothetical protein HC841_02895 [Verrucomicrobiae bacterium]|nr:hypothetical protein [Verrucomicrobiae bacterium]